MIWTLLATLSLTPFALAQDDAAEEDGAEESGEAAPALTPEMMQQAIGGDQIVPLEGLQGAEPAEGEAVEGAPVEGQLPNLQDGCPELPFDPTGGTGGGELIDFSQAVEAEAISAEELEEFKPRLRLLPQNPRAQTDFTAYTLEQGEVKLGLVSSVGIFDNTQLSTNVMLLAVPPLLGSSAVPNATLKVDAIQEGPLDVGVSLGRFGINDLVGGVTGGVSPLEGIASVHVVGGWSVHGGAAYNIINASVPTDDSTVSLAADALTARFATDYRFNRRDSVIFQLNTLTNFNLRTDGVDTSVLDPLINSLPDVFGIKDTLDFALNHDGPVDLFEIYSLSLAWQFRWKRAELRFGVGYSKPFQYSWFNNSFAFTYRFGGETRRQETQQRRTWRQNRRDAQGTETGAE